MKFQGFSASLILKMVKNEDVVAEDWVERLSGVTCLHPCLTLPLHCCGGDLASGRLLR